MAYLEETMSLHTEVEAQTGVSTDPLDRKNNFQNPAKRDVRIRSLSVSTPPELDDENSKYLTGDFTGDESIVGMKPGTVDFNIKFAPGELNNNAINGIAATVSLTTGGTATALTPGSYEITQGIDFTSAGSGTGLILAVTVDSTSITSVDGIIEGGEGNIATDVLTVTQVNGEPFDTLSATITIDTVENIAYQHNLNYDKYLATSGLKEVKLFDNSVSESDYQYPVKHLFFPSIQQYENTLSMGIVQKDPKPGRDGIFADMKGSIGDITLTADTVGAPFTMAFNYNNGVEEVDDIPAAQMGNFLFDDDSVMRTVADKLLNTTIKVKDIELDAYVTGEFCVSSLSFAQGNQRVMRDCQADASGIKSYAITGMQPRVEIDPELVSLSDFDYWQALTEERFYQLEIESKYNSPTGEVVLQMFIPRAQLINSEIGTDEGFRRNAMTWRPLRNIDKTIPVVTYQNATTGADITWDGSDLTDAEKAEAMYYWVFSEIPKGFTPTP